MQYKDKKVVASMINSLECFVEAQNTMTDEGWKELNQRLSDLDETSIATWNDINAFKEDLEAALAALTC